MLVYSPCLTEQGCCLFFNSYCQRIGPLEIFRTGIFPFLPGTWAVCKSYLWIGSEVEFCNSYRGVANVIWKVSAWDYSFRIPVDFRKNARYGSFSPEKNQSPVLKICWTEWMLLVFVSDWKLMISEDIGFQSYGSEQGYWLLLLFVTPNLKKDIFNISPG